MKKNIVIFFLFLFFSQIIFAQSLPSIQLDRPDQTECSYIVPTNCLQLESGLNFEKVDDDEQNIVLPTILWKYGINDKMELRLITETINNVFKSNSNFGLKPIKIGFKTKLLEEKGIIPLTSIIAHLAIPYLSTENFRTTYFAPSFRFTMQHAVSEKVTVAYNLGAEWNGESAEPIFIYTATTGYSLTEKMGAYIELYGFLPQKNNADHRCDGGITYLAKHNIMLDFSGGVGITKNAPAYYASLGFSIRLPK